VHTISPASPLPAVTQPAFIDGASQPGFAQANAPRVVLDGTNAGNAAFTNGLTLMADGCTVRGLAVANFKNGAGVEVQSAGNVVVANFIGTDATGTHAAGNFAGVEVGTGAGQAANNVIENNLISGDLSSGVSVFSKGPGTVVSANLIGTDISGTKALGDDLGVFLSAPGCRVGGNVISGNQAEGLTLSMGADGSVAANNLIGTDAGGTHALPNGDGVGIGQVTVCTLQANVISGNTSFGVRLGEIGTDRHLLLGNLIGTDLSGTKPLGNGGYGIEMRVGVTNCVVAGNTVAANAAGGILIIGNDPLFPPTGNVVAGNRVGTDATGTQALGNGGLAGIELFRNATNNVIDSNLVAGNLADGVFVHDAGATGNTVRRNLVGLTVAGVPLPNGLHGVELAQGASGTTVFANAVLFNKGHGILLHDAGTTGNAVQANNSSFNGGAGVMVAAGAAGNSVGGAAPGQGNVLSFNGQAGAWVDGPATTGVLIEGNAIAGNGGLGGIALTNGGNFISPPPALAYAFSVGSASTTAVGTLHAAASTTYHLEFFDSPAGGGQGQTFLGFVSVTTDASGNAAFAADFAGALTSLTATSTGPNNNTSVFSAPVPVAHL
jgi:large repetitive protein